jgi:hypothetical protein
MVKIQVVANPLSYDLEYLLPIGDVDFLREFERPAQAVTLAYPTHKYGYLLSQFVLEEYDTGDTRVLKSALVVDHVDRPTANWHLAMWMPDATAEDVRALVRDAIGLVLEKYQRVYRNGAYC